jgi:hypothetical protein
MWLNGDGIVVLMLSPDPFIRNGRNFYYCGYFLFGFFSLSGAVFNNSCAKTAVTDG